MAVPDPLATRDGRGRRQVTDEGGEVRGAVARHVSARGDDTPRAARDSEPWGPDEVLRDVRYPVGGDVS